MTLSFREGDLFAEPVETLVNTVNCVGVMGKGVALEFKRRWPANFKAYKKLCDDKQLVPGKLFVFETGELFASEGPKYLINFPTKDHWRAKSQISYVEDGLDALVKAIRDYNIKSIAMPPLGCGNGGLDWADVKPLIAAKLGSLDGVEIVVFPPKVEADEPEYVNAKFPMTYERAMLLKSLGDLERYFDGSFDRISLQKIGYFLQVLGVNFQLTFSQDLHGPYSEALKKAFVALDRHGMLKGFREKERQAHVTPSGYAIADEFLKDSVSDGTNIISKIDKLIQGYESPYGLELLSSVHYLAHHEHHSSEESVIEEMHGWSDKKRNSFDVGAIKLAYKRLHEDMLLP